MGNINKELEDKLNKLTDEELVEMIQIKYEDYTEDALEVAKSVAEYRGGLEHIKIKIENVHQQELQAKEKEAEKRKGLEKTLSKEKRKTKNVSKGISMSKQCSYCGEKLSFRNSFVWENKPTCRSCLEDLEQKKKLDSKQETSTNVNETNKRILGIILASIGGIAGVIFGLTLSSASNKIFLLNSQKEQAITTYGILTVISIVIFLFGINMILTTKTTSETVKIVLTKEPKTKSYSSELDNLEKLAELRDKNIITEEEFNTKKKKILES